MHPVDKSLSNGELLLKPTALSNRMDTYPSNGQCCPTFQQLELDLPRGIRRVSTSETLKIPSVLFF